METLSEHWDWHRRRTEHDIRTPYGCNCTKEANQHGDIGGGGLIFGTLEKVPGLLTSAGSDSKVCECTHDMGCRGGPQQL